MKTSIIFIALTVIALLPSSSSAKIEVPVCMKKMIDGFNATPRSSPYIRIDNYLYHGKMTYLATSSCCDRFNPLFDGECNRICAPSGGFIGRGNGQCTDFSEKATQMGNIWIVPRS